MYANGNWAVCGIPGVFLLRCKVSELVRRLRTVDVVRVNIMMVMVCERDTKGATVGRAEPASLIT